MDRRNFFLSLAGGAVALGALGATTASAAPVAAATPAAAAPVEMQWAYGFYGPRPFRPVRRCWINRWGERVCRF